MRKPCFNAPLGISGEWKLWLCGVRAVVEVKRVVVALRDAEQVNWVLTGAVVSA